AFLGQLDQGGQKAFLNGAPLSFGSLGEPLKKLVRKIVFGSSGSSPLNCRCFMEMGKTDAESEEGYAGEVTDLLPNGIPNQATIRLFRKDDPLLYGID